MHTYILPLVLQAGKPKDLGELPTPERGTRQKRSKTSHLSFNNASMADDDDEIFMPSKNCDMSAEHVVTYLAGLSEKRLSRTIRAWCADYGAGIVPLQRRGLEKRVKHFHSKRLVKAFKPWNDSGRENIISPPELKAWVLSHRPGETIGLVEVQRLLESKTGRAVDDKCLRTYLAHALFYCQRVTEQTKYKQECRDTAEKSMRRPQALAAAILHTHILPGKSSVAPSPKQFTKAMKAVSESHGNVEVHCIEDACCFNTDDVGVHFHLGALPRKEVRGVPHSADSGHYASFRLTNPDPSKFMSAHFSTTASADGWIAPPVVRFVVKEREWMGGAGDDFTVFKVPDLARGGDSCPSRMNSAVGYIVAMRNSGDKDSESVDAAFFRWYHTNIVLPFIEEVRQEKFAKFG